MSYCRFSSDNFKCQLYIYQADLDGRYVIHTATNKVVTPIFPCPDWLLLKFPVNWLGTRLFWLCYKLHLFTVKHGIRRQLNLPYAGWTFREDSLEDLRDRVEYLGELGWKYPSWLLDVIDEEIALREGFRQESKDAEVIVTPEMISGYGHVNVIGPDGHVARIDPESV